MLVSRRLVIGWARIKMSKFAGNLKLLYNGVSLKPLYPYIE